MGLLGVLDSTYIGTGIAAATAVVIVFLLLGLCCSWLAMNHYYHYKLKEFAQSVYCCNVIDKLAKTLHITSI